MIYKVRELLLWTVLWILTLQYLLQLLIRLVSEKKGKKPSPLNKEENDSQISNNKHIKLKNHLFQCLSCHLVTHAHNCLARLFSPHTAILCLWGINWKRATLTESWEEHTNSEVELNQQTSRFFFMSLSQMHAQFGFGYLHTLRDSKIFTHLGKQNKGASPTYIQTALSLWKHSIHQPRYFNDRSRPPNCPDTSLSAQNSRNTAPCLEMCHPARITIQSHQPRAIATEKIAQPV